MSKSVILSKEYNRRKFNVKHFLDKRVHSSFLKDLRLSLLERQVIYQKFTKFSYKSSVVRLKNYCMLTGHSRSIYRDVNLSRHQFNQMVLNGQIPGWAPASW